MSYDINAYVEYRLDSWATWYTQHSDLGLGYPKQSIEARLLYGDGILVNHQYGRHEVMCNDDAEEIEKMVLELNKQNERLAKVLREQYFGQGTAKRKAERLKMSYESFKMQLDLAKQWLTGRLSLSYQQRLGC